MRTYHIGFSKHKRSLIIEACRDKDYLSCELYHYLGEHITTKAKLRADRYKILAAARSQWPHVYGSVRYAQVW